jgi:uridine kinase
MLLPPTPRVLFLRQLVGAIRREAPAGRVVVAVDSGSGGGGASSGGVAFADDLALVFLEAGADTFRASLGGFHYSRAFRMRLGRETPESYYRDGYDYVTLRRVLLDPFRLAGSTGFQTTAFDAVRDVPVEARWLTAGQDAVLVLDGEFPLRPSLRSEWTASVLLTNVPQAPAYVEDARPAEFATYLVDESEPSHPRWAPREGEAP